MAHITDWMATAKPDPEWEEAPDIGQFPDIASLRKWITQSKEDGAAEMGGSISGVKESDHQVEMRDGHKITCRTYHPESSGGSPLFVMYHGGGWCIGGLENEELLCRLMTSKLGMTCVNVDYRLAPEHQFPVPILDCYDATKWAAENASTLGADPSKGFIVGGTSAGGNVSAVIAHMWRDAGDKPGLTGCHLMIPAICYGAFLPEKYRGECKSFEQNKNAPILSAKACDLFTDNYIPEMEDRKDPMFSPLLVPTGQKGLPASYFQICGMDPLRDEALVYERILRRDEGVQTKVDMYPGLPHGYWSIAPKLKVSEKFVQDSVKGAEWLLQQK
ncbi:hypothetical protein LTR91_016719 [Friedmanniomyces endolithicus]|uniref:Alpha/beta hydrolase fold-3 domain-containing protein n=1 Tax=Friedmanniomyces endolithicus TaxID=329885 RepID=A0AAN6QKG0_9PEZI|nr:hypothetical protein LTR35_015774 [Friedmanniomyces endolithicus]KAK0275820.1 hypothetical protein LTS00_014853 [Friedmanniomyces endolithicus]KAK0307829.1 hypothetical protein LTR82_015765 [Friedmanniomyces endolithicus]KAK0311883.1 hypothetical protein LTR01_002797 [Friedmanniomyces endolithicus]KAK0832116.1 hypothetical protein LTR73_002403 [Friedmanniomyces endolithicus]